MKSKGFFLVCKRVKLKGDDVGCLQALGAFFDREFDLLTFFESAEALSLDRAVMDEDISAAIAADKTITLRSIEPLDRSDYTF
jgi:hypothetical protein